MGEINFFKNQEINQKLIAIWGVFIQEIQLNLVAKTRELCDTLTFPIFYSPTPQYL